MKIIIRPTAQDTYFRIVDPEDPTQNWGIVSPASGQLAVRPTLRHYLKSAETYGEKEWNSGPGRHGGVSDYEHSDGFTSGDETLGYLSRSFGRLGFSIQDERDLTARG